MQRGWRTIRRIQAPVPRSTLNFTARRACRETISGVTPKPRLKASVKRAAGARPTRAATDFREPSRDSSIRAAFVIAANRSQG